MMPIIVIARAKAKKGCEELMEKAMRAVMAPTHAESGCVKYTLNRSTEDKGLFVTIEKWDSLEAHERHLGSSHIQDLFKKLPELIAGSPDIQVLRPAGEGASDKSYL